MFRKKFLKLRNRPNMAIAESTPVIEYVEKTSPEQDELGTSIERAYYLPLDVTSKQAMESLPDAKDYSLENLLAAGVPIDQLSVSTMFNPTDYATNQRLAENMIASVSIESKTE